MTDILEDLAEARSMLDAARTALERDQSGELTPYRVRLERMVAELERIERVVAGQLVASK